MAFSRLKHLFSANKYLNTEIEIKGPQGPRFLLNNKPVINLSSSDYLGLCNDPKTIKHFQSSIDAYGFGLSSGRIICGTHLIHKQLESSLAQFFNKEDSILYSSGYDANTGIFEALLQSNDEVFIDELSNPSMFDGINLSSCKKTLYNHNDLNKLEYDLKSSDARIKMIATDALFAYYGCFAPLDRLVQLAERHSALIMVDESHSFGTVAGGKGVAEHFKVLDQIDIVNCSLAKSLGGATGGVSVGKQDIIDILRQKSRSYLFTNALAPMIAGTCLELLKELNKENSDLLLQVIQEFRTKLKAKNFNILGHEFSPIVPILIGDDSICQNIHEAFLNLGVYIAAIKYPIVPINQARLRVQLSTGHKEDLDYIIDCFEKVSKEYKVIIS